MSARLTISPLRLANLLAGTLALATLGVFAFSDTLRVTLLPDGRDKELHVAAFCACGFMLMLGARAPALVATVFVLACAAIGVEWAQPIITATREASVADAAASVLGVLLGACGALAANGVIKSAPARVKQR